MLHQRTHPNLDVEGCFGCKAAGVTVTVPYYMSARMKSPETGMTGIDESAQFKRELTTALRNDKEGRFVRSSRA